ncbi:MAG: nucleoside monophosphate kinase [Patescibacteria group bacterium]|jgi:adenylate kinase family enzyme
MAKKTIYSFLGLPGSGKGTQAELFLKEIGADLFISVGTLIREYMARNEDSDYARAVKERYDSGEPQPDDVAIKLLSDYLHEATGTIILDNFPFGRGQAEFLLNFIKENPEWAGPVVIYIKIKPETSLARIAGRLTCTQCGGTYDSSVRGNCPKCGTILETRADDESEIVKNRLSFYIPKMEEVIDYLRQENVKLFEIDGERSVEAIALELAMIAHE